MTQRMPVPIALALLLIASLPAQADRTPLDDTGGLPAVSDLFNDDVGSVPSIGDTPVEVTAEPCVDACENEYRACNAACRAEYVACKAANTPHIDCNLLYEQCEKSCRKAFEDCMRTCRSITVGIEKPEFAVEGTDGNARCSVWSRVLPELVLVA